MKADFAGFGISFAHQEAVGLSDFPPVQKESPPYLAGSWQTVRHFPAPIPPRRGKACPLLPETSRRRPPREGALRLSCGQRDFLRTPEPDRQRRDHCSGVVRSLGSKRASENSALGAEPIETEVRGAPPLRRALDGTGHHGVLRLASSPQCTPYIFGWSDG
jgi:hypothetical protein